MIYLPKIHNIIHIDEVPLDLFRLFPITTQEITTLIIWYVSLPGYSPTLQKLRSIDLQEEVFFSPRKWPWSTYNSANCSFHSTVYFWDQSMLMWIALICSSEFPCNVPAYEHTMSCLSTPAMVRLFPIVLDTNNFHRYCKLPPKVRDHFTIPTRSIGKQPFSHNSIILDINKLHHCRTSR